jgi:hypothetical protein
MFGNESLSAATRKARLRLSRRAPEATIRRHGCTLEFEGARCAIASASSSNAGGTGRARKRRIDRRSRMTWSRIDECSRFCIVSNLNRRTTPADSESSFLSNHSPKRIGAACRLLRFFSTELLLDWPRENATQSRHKIRQLRQAYRFPDLKIKLIGNKL